VKPLLGNVAEGIPVTVITDSMAAQCMQRGLIDAVVVGADTANGDTANKIGTYSLALVAKAHDIPSLSLHLSAIVLSYPPVAKFKLKMIHLRFIRWAIQLSLQGGVLQSSV